MSNSQTRSFLKAFSSDGIASAIYNSEDAKLINQQMTIKVLRDKLFRLQAQLDAMANRADMCERQVRDLARENERLRRENAALHSK